MSHSQLLILFLLWLHLFILSGVISPLISSNILGTYRPGEFLFQCPIILPFHTYYNISHLKYSVQFSPLAQPCLTLCDPMNRSTPGLPVHHQLPEFTQTHVHQIGDAIQPSHPLSSPSPPVFNLSQHQGLFR